MSASGTNRLLASLSAECRAQLLSHCKEIPLPARMVLQEQDARPRYAYFLTSGFASVVAHLPEGGGAEVALLGRESVVGGLALLGPAVPSTVGVMQLAGTGYQIRFTELLRLFRESQEVRERMLQSAQVQALTTNQIVVCNTQHPAEARLARWLLMVHDRVDEANLPLTQEFMAEMLGTRRTTVALAAGALQRAGTIQYARGQVRLVSKAALEEAACGCYIVAKRLFDGLYK